VGTLVQQYLAWKEVAVGQISCDLAAAIERAESAHIQRLVHTTILTTSSVAKPHPGTVKLSFLNALEKTQGSVDIAGLTRGLEQNKKLTSDFRYFHRRNQSIVECTTFCILTAVLLGNHHQWHHYSDCMASSCPYITSLHTHRPLIFDGLVVLNLISLGHQLSPDKSSE
jgi:hypothetical protein